MSYCLNPACAEPQNPDSAVLCQSCGSSLLLKDRYRPLKLLGQGGFGRTFLTLDQHRDPQGDDPRSGSPSTTEKPALCVIKQFLSPYPASPQQKRAIALFQQEAQRLSELGQHPQIPALLDAFQQDQQFYLVQAFIEGQTLEQALAERGAFTEAAIWQLLMDVLPVLKFIHDRQIIHRDLKPANLIRSTDGRLVLVDFGAAKVVTPTDELKPGTSIGSAEYVAPEQARGKAVFASDLYSLGVTCIHLLTDIPPFDLFDSINDTWIWQQYLPQSVSTSLVSLLDRLLQNALSKRFQSVEQVLQAAGLGDGGSGVSAPGPIAALATLTGHTASVNAVAFSPNGQLLASGSDDKTVRLWNLVTGEEMGVLSGHTQAVRSLAFHSAGTILVSAGQDKTIRLWDVATKDLKAVLQDHTQAVRSVVFSPDGALLVSASWDKTIKFWDWQTGTVLYTLAAHRLQVTAVAFSPDGRLLASASCDRTARLWDLYPSGQLAPQVRYSFAEHTGSVAAIAFSPDGKILATGGDDRAIRLWDTRTRRLLRILSGHSWSISALAFSPDGKTLVSGSLDTPLKIWPLASEEARAIEFKGHADSVHALAVSPDGTGIASGSRDCTIRLWPANP